MIAKNSNKDTEFHLLTSQVFRILGSVEGEYDNKEFPMTPLNGASSTLNRQNPVIGNFDLISSQTPQELMNISF